MKIKNKDFVELEYTGKTTEDEQVFDTTDEMLAKSAGIHQPNKKYGGKILCIGQGQLIPGLDKTIEGREIGKFSITLSPDEAFGKKDVKLIQLIPTSRFKQDKIKPMPGMQINVDGNLGFVKTVSGGRTMVDFNHPLSGKEVQYDINITRIVSDLKEKINSYVSTILGIEEITVQEVEKKWEVTLPFELPVEIQNELNKKLKETIGTEVQFKKA